MSADQPRVRLLVPSGHAAGLADQRLTIRWAAVVNPSVSFHTSPGLLDLCRFYPVPIDLLGGRADTVASLLSRSGQAKVEDAVREWLTGNAKLALATQVHLLHDWVRGRLLSVLAAGVEEGSELWQLSHRLLRDPEALAGTIHCSEPERAALRSILDWGLTDALRLHTQEAGIYSWWDFRAGMFRRGLGLRIDLVMVSEPMAARCVSVEVDKRARGGEKPSDHAPVLATFE